MNRDLTQLGVVAGQSDLINDPAERVLPELRSASVALVFTSPPYFNRDLLGLLLSESARILKRHGTLLLNVADAGRNLLIDDTKRLACKYLRLYKVYWMSVPLRPFQRALHGRAYKTEPVLAFRRF